MPVKHVCVLDFSGSFPLYPLTWCHVKWVLCHQCMTSVSGPPDAENDCECVH